MRHFEKEDTNGARMTNWWRSTTTHKHVHTRFKLLHNLTAAQQNSNMFENRQTVARTTKPHHTRSNSLRKLLDRVWGPLQSKRAKAAEDKALHLWVLCGRPNRVIRSLYNMKITVFIIEAERV